MGLDYQTITRALEPDRLDVNPVLERLNDGDPTPFAYAQVTQIRDRAGSTPAEAEVIIRNVNGVDDDPTLVTLQNTGPLCSANLPGGTRVRITCDNDTLFIGDLVLREEMGSAGAIKLTFEDDRRALWKMPVWGCLVAEAGNATEAKFCPRLPFRINPFGAGNCREILITGVSWPVPVFTHVAYTTASMDAARGYPTFWTPERLLKHLWYRLYSWSGGTGDDPFAHVPRMGTKFSWDPQSCSFAAEEMQQKLPDVQFNGWKVPGIFDKTFEIVGSYGWNVAFWNTQACINFFRRTQVDYTNEPSEPPLEGVPIQLQRAGSATDSNTAFDFHWADDYRKTITQLTVEGAPPEIEAQFSYTAVSGDTMEYAHTAAELAAFRAIIKGNGTHAVVDGVILNGAGGTVHVDAKTDAAIEVARHRYPSVGALKLKDGDSLDTILSGYEAEFAGLYGLDTLSIARSLAGSEQFTRIDTSDARFGIRIQVDDTNDGANWHTVKVNPGIRVTDDGLIVLDGLMSDGVGNDALYFYLMADMPDDFTFKHVRINAVIFHDARVSSTIGIRSSDEFAGRSADPNGISSELDHSWCQQSTGPAEYVLATEREPDQMRPEEDGSFRKQHRVGSVYSDGASATSDVYRDDQADLDAYASRRFKDLARVGRAATWKMIGVRGDYRIGMFIGSMVERGGDPPKTGSRVINAALTEVVYRFDGSQHSQLSTDGF